jgi:hypothetical protein
MLTFNTTQSHLVISGKAFYAREAIKKLGGRWDPYARAWTLPVHIDSQMLRGDLEKKAAIAAQVEKDMAKAKRIYQVSPEGIADAKQREMMRVISALEEKKTTGAYYWICCDKCEVLDWHRGHTICQAHAVDGNAFRIRGGLFTGD